MYNKARVKHRAHKQTGRTLNTKNTTIKKYAIDIQNLTGTH